MSELLGALGGLVNKVATKTEDGLQRFANKTEDVAKRVNRTVNPLSSHFRESSSATNDHQRPSEHISTASAPQNDRHVRGDAGPSAAPEHLRRDVGAAHSSNRSQEADEAHAKFQQEGLSTKSALMVADEISRVVQLEISKLELERDEYQSILQQLQQLRKVQEEAYMKSEARMEQRELELRKQIQAMEKEQAGQQAGMTVSF